MGRHEIRLRRKKMTSRRIESHKDYYDLLRKHERSSMGKKLLRAIIYIIIFLGMVLLGYFVFDKTNQKHDKTIQTDNQAYKTSRPGVLIIDVLLNPKQNGKT